MMNIPFISIFFIHILLHVHNKKVVSICAAMTSLPGLCRCMAIYLGITLLGELNLSMQRYNNGPN